MNRVRRHRRRLFFHRPCRSLALPVVMTCLLASPAAFVAAADDVIVVNSIPAVSRQLDANSSSATTPKTLAILIGVSNYNRDRKLQWCDNDVALVEQSLREYTDCEDFVVMTNNSDESEKPVRGNVLGVLSEQELQLAALNGCTRLIVFIAGHGIRHQGELYFCPQDFVPSDPHNSGLSMTLIREKMNAVSDFTEKFLFLDICHAGPQVGPNDAATIEAGLRTKEAGNLFTLAGCTADESSLETVQKQHGLFTYYLCQALQGHADASPHGNGDRQVDTDELTRYVRRFVQQEASRIGERQHPISIVTRDWVRPRVLARIRTIRRLERLGPVRQTQLEQHVEAAAKYVRGGSYRSAIAELTPALRIDAQHPDVLALRGLSRLYVARQLKQAGQPQFTRRYREAEADLTAAIRFERRRDPQRLASFYSLRSAVRFEQQRKTDALADATEVIKLQPSAKAYRNRSYIQKSLGRADQAEKDLQAAARLATS